jgi:hypothetical protein
MKKVGLIIFIAALVAGVVVANVFSFGKTDYKFFNFKIGWSGVQGSGNTQTEKRDVAGFKSVEVSGALQVEIAAGKEFSVEVQADDNLLPLIKTEVEGGVLRIRSEKRISPKGPLVIRVSAPDIDGIDASGASGIMLSGVKNSALRVESSGASKINVEGTTGTLTVDVSGASTVDASNLPSENANVEASGACSVKVNATNEVQAEASGASKIRYLGAPKNLIKKTSGGSRVEQK